MEEIILGPNEEIYKEGTQNDKIYFLRKGEVSIYV